jgi:hypothetical protein
LFSVMLEFYHWLIQELSICDYNLGDETADISLPDCHDNSIVIAQRM